MKNKYKVLCLLFVSIFFCSFPVPSKAYGREYNYACSNAFSIMESAINSYNRSNPYDPITNITPFNAKRIHDKLLQRHFLSEECKCPGSRGYYSTYSSSEPEERRSLYFYSVGDITPSHCTLLCPLHSPANDIKGKKIDYANSRSYFSRISREEMFNVFIMSLVVSIIFSLICTSFLAVKMKSVK